VRERAPFQEIWERRAFCVLGEGDIDLEGVLATIDEIGYSGWLVVEQDIFPDPLDDQHCFVDQALNRAYLREHGL
jgi:inosose dehydratase